MNPQTQQPAGRAAPAVDRICATCGARPRVGQLENLCERCLARCLLSDPGTEDAGTVDQPTAGATPGFVGGAPKRLGDYELEEEIGHGGMGVVYRARQCSLRRTVAVKLLLMGRFAGESSIQRFLREAEAAARLRHPNIVSVHDIGFEAGHHYFSMDYVEGQSLAERLRVAPLASNAAAACCRTMAEAVHYAHRQGILHRDLKPSNVLIDAAEEPHITDFGLAKRLDELGDLTVTGELLGSPSYLSPEQASGRQDEVGPRSDVYGLGAILYECLTGRPPFLARSLPETLLRIRDTAPVPPRQLCPDLSIDLEAVVLKCLEKSPSGRYATAADLAADLGRFLAGEPTQARQVGPLGRGLRWARRKPMHALALGLATLTTVVTGLAGYRAWQSRLEVQEVNNRLASHIRRLEWEAAEDSVSEGRVADAMVSFARLLRDRPDDQALATRLASLLGQRAFALPIGSPMAHEGPVTSVEFSPDFASILTASVDGSARLWRAEDGGLIRRFTDRGPLAQACFGAGSQRVLTLSAAGGARLWRAEDGSLLREWLVPADTPGLAAVEPVGSIGAIALGPRTIRVINLGSGQEIGEPLTHQARVSVALVGNGARSLITGTEAGELCQWSMLGSDIRRRGSTDLRSPVTALALTPDGGRLLAGTRGGGFFIFDASELGRPLAESEGPDVVQFIRCAPDGSRALVSRFGEWLQVWDLRGPSIEGVFRRTDTDIVLQAGWSPDGANVLLGFRSGMAALYDAHSREPVQEAFEHQGPIVGIGFHTDGHRIVTASQDATARLWNVRARMAKQPTVKLPGRPGSEIILSGNVLRVAAMHGPDAWVCDARSGATIGAGFHHDSEVRAAVLSPNGRRLATGSLGLRLWELDGAGLRLGPLGVAESTEAIAWAPDGAWLVAASRSGRVGRWEASTGRPLADELVLPTSVGRLGVSPDGQKFIAICGDATVRIVDCATGREQSAPLQHQGRIWTAEFSPDSRRLVTASVDRMVRVWDVATGQQMGRSMPHERAALIARFSPDGRVIASGGEDRVVRLWDSETGRPLAPPLRHGSRVWILSFSPDGRRLLTAADLGEARVWDVRTGFPLSDPLSQKDTMLRAWLLPGGDEVLAATHGGVLTAWRLDAAPALTVGWLPDLAEALAGRRLASDGELAPVRPGTLQRLAFELSAMPAASQDRGWARRFALRHALAPSLEQTFAPVSAEK